MNQAQRKFLIDRITETVRAGIDELKKQEVETPPSLENYFYGLALTGKLEIQPTEHIKAVFCKRALGHGSNRYSETWLGTSQGDFVDKAKVKIDIKDIFVLPDEYNTLWNIYRANEDQKNARIAKLVNERDTLITRIQLASDKVLEKMIGEIDDMGDISLMDTKLKSLAYPGDDKPQLT